MSEQGETSKQSSKQSKTDEKVTSVEKSEKVKDPRKVELGKRLAKISREAKERKAKMWSESDREAGHERTRFAKEINDYVDFRYFVGGVTIVAALGGLYYAYKSDKRLESERSEHEIQSDRERKDKKVNIINKNDYEITKCNHPLEPTTQTACSFAAESEGWSQSCIENL